MESQESAVGFLQDQVAHFEWEEAGLHRRTVVCVKGKEPVIETAITLSNIQN